MSDTDKREIAYWKSRPIDDMSAEELREALRQLSKMYHDALQLRIDNIEMLGKRR